MPPKYLEDTESAGFSLRTCSFVQTVSNCTMTVGIASWPELARVKGGVWWGALGWGGEVGFILWGLIFWLDNRWGYRDLSPSRGSVQVRCEGYFCVCGIVDEKEDTLKMLPLNRDALASHAGFWIDHIMLQPRWFADDWEWYHHSVASFS